MTSETVRLAAAAPDLNHRDPVYLQVIQDVRAGLLSVYPETQSGWHPYLIGGSGTAAVEAMVTSCVEKGPVLILDDGYYSGRIREILDVHHIPCQVLKFDWLDGYDYNLIEQTLAKGSFEAVLMTHHETTLGRLNDITQIGLMSHQRGSRLLVDAMSSFGADPIDFTHITAIASSANKCLHGLPGVSFVLVRDSLAGAMAAFPRRTYYLHLPMMAGEQPPLTPPVPTMLSLRQALAENPGGQADRFRSYSAKNRLLRQGVQELGLSIAIEEAKSSVTLVSPTLPNGWEYDPWFEANYSKGFVLYGTKAEYRNRFFQASVMGEITEEQIAAWLAAASQILSTS